MFKVQKISFILFLSIVVLFVVAFSGSGANAAVPQYLGYEGYLTTATDAAVTDTLGMTFRIYDALAAGNLLWSETHSSVSVADGYFSVQLGSVTALTLDFEEPYWISIQVGVDGEMTPRQPINAVGYSYMSDNAYAVTDADLDTTIDAPTDDQIDIAISGADDFLFVANILRALSGSSFETDTINETNTGVGVTIDSITLKDGGATVITGGTNTFNITNGTSSLDVAAGSALNVDANLTVELASIVNQDLTTDASVAFTGLSNTDADITAVGDIALDSISSAASNISIAATNATDILQIGDGTYSWGHSPMVGIEGALEVDGATYLDGGIVSGGSGLYMSSGFITSASPATDGAFQMKNTSQTPDTIMLFTGTLSNNMVMAEYGDATYDFAHTQQTNPTLFINSANQSSDEWISFAHDQTDGVIDVGTGTIKMNDNVGMAGNDILNVDQITGNSTLLTIGDTGVATGHTLAANDDLHVTGKLEVDGTIYLDGLAYSYGSIVMIDNYAYVLGNSSDVRLEFDTAQTVNSMIFNLDNTSRTIIFQESADVNTDYEIAAQDDPTIIIHSNDATDIDEYLSLAHEGANDYAVIKTGDSSDIKFESSILAGAYEFAEDAGFVTAMDMSVSATPAQGTQESYAFKIDGNSFMKIYSEADTAGSIENGSIRFYEPVVYLPSADQARLDDSAITCTDTITRVVGSGGAVVLDTAPAINDGTEDGQFCIIEGTSDANTVQIVDNVNVQLSGGVAFTLGIGDTLTLIWDAGDSDWYEIGRSDN